MEVTARIFDMPRSVRIRVKDDHIESIEAIPPQEDEDGGNLWAVPAFWDIQMNGRWGVSFASPDLTMEQVAEIVLAQAKLGTARVCPTLITADQGILIHGLKTIASACDRWPEIDRMVAGIHLEGPCISELDGYRGAHPLDAVRDPDLGEFTAWQAAGGGRVKIVTLAPERRGAIDFIRSLHAQGVVVALGHTAAEGATIRAAVDAGASLSTHLGNGIASPLPRHPNPIWHQAAIDRLFASFIGDGHHLDRDTFLVLTRAKGPDRTILVSDFSPLAGLPVGDYGPWAVDPSGKIVVAGTPYLAGSNQPLETGVTNLLDATEYGFQLAIGTVTTNPAKLLGMRAPEIAPGMPANLVVLESDALIAEVTVRRTCVDGRWFEAEPS